MRLLKTLVFLSVAILSAGLVSIAGSAPALADMAPAITEAFGTPSFELAALDQVLLIAAIGVAVLLLIVDWPPPRMAGDEPGNDNQASFRRDPRPPG